MDMLSNVMWLHPKLSKIQRLGVQALPIHAWSRKMRSPNSSAWSPLTRGLSGLRFIELQNGHVCLHHVLMEVKQNPGIFT